MSTLTNLETLCANRGEILSDFLHERQWAVNEKDANDRTFLLPPCEDTSRWKDLVELISRQGIEAEYAQKPFVAENVVDIWANKLASRTFPKGMLVARSRQPHHRMLHTLCTFEPHLTDSLTMAHPVHTVVRLAEKNELRLSGLLWPEAGQRLANTAYATVDSVGRGQLILFATDPTYRMWLPCMQRLFFNATLSGPGMGTSQPLPW